jgi:hypothetical protein
MGKRNFQVVQINVKLVILIHLKNHVPAKLVFWGPKLNYVYVKLLHRALASFILFTSYLISTLFPFQILTAVIFQN